MQVLTTFLELAGVALLAAFVWFVWPPLVLAVLGAAALALSWAIERGKAPVKA